MRDTYGAPPPRTHRRPLHTCLNWELNRQQATFREDPKPLEGEKIFDSRYSSSCRRAVVDLTMATWQPTRTDWQDPASAGNQP